MLKITTVRLLIVLVVLLGIFAVIKFTGNKDRSSTFRTELTTHDPEKVTRVEIDDPKGSVSLEKDGENWMVSGPEGTKKAVTNTVKSMLSTLKDVQPSRIASRSDSKWKDYSVDSTGTRVRIYEGSKLVTDIVLGRFGVEGQQSFYTYVRLSEDDDTYVANNFMKMSINTTVNDYRNSEILRLNKDSLATISFNYPDSSVVLVNSEGKWFKGVQEADSAGSVSYVRSLSFVSSRNFVEVDALGTPDLNVTFGFRSPPEIQISAYKSPEGWILQSSSNPDELWIDEDQFDKIFAASSRF